jgi:cyclopropane fatty-acyl-phospholipid synthase-like methyltransferase
VVTTRAEAASVARFTDSYRLCCSPVRLDLEYTVLGADYGSTGYTTRAQADRLGRDLGLAPGVRLADLGAGSGWPGLYLAGQSGCHVVGTDLPVDGLVRARSRSIEDGVADLASYVVATGRRQPFRPSIFDAVVHTDVLCCLGPKLAVLRACAQLLRSGGRLAFTTIHVAPGLDATRHRRAVRAGPWHVATRRAYAELVVQGGFVDVTEVDVTDDYARTQRAWLEAYEAHADELRTLTSDEDFALGQAERRRTRTAIEDGLLRRSLLAATAP